MLTARPCPFYQQGSCFFADNCNFLHTVSATVISEALPSNHSVDATPKPTNLPCVVVDSPSPDPSPRRSPGTTSVLLALRLIDHDDPDVVENKSNATSQSDESSQDTLTGEVTAWSEALPTLVNEGFPIIDGILQEESYYTDDDMDDYAGNWTAISDYNDLSPQPFSQDNDQEGVENLMPIVDDDHSEEEDTVQIPVSSHPESDVQPSSFEVPQSGRVDPSSHASIDLLSPIELSTLNLGPLRLDDRVVTDDNSFDSGYADTWKPPNPLLPSPPRSPSISSTFDLLSSPFGPISSRIMSPYLGAFLARSPVSPARTISLAMLDEVPPLDLGLGSPEENTSSLVSNVDNKSYSSPHSSSNDQDLADVSDSRVEEIKDELIDDLPDHDHDSYDTSIWDPEGGPTAVFVGPDENYVREQVTTTIRRQSRSSLHFLQSPDTNFVDDDALAHSSLNDEGASTSQLPSEPVEEEYDISQVSLGSDDSVFLAYLKSPPRPTEGDTLTSLYDIYSDIAPSKDVISDSIRNAGLSPPKPPAPTMSNTSSPASSLRGRVFTPPTSGKKRPGTSTPASISSPPTSIDPSSVGYSSPFSILDDPTGSQSSQDEASKKVPFGFRQSFTMVSLIPTLLQIRRDMPS